MANKKRKLASVQRVNKIEAIPDADLIESVGVLGWHCVASKGDFHVGDLCVYFEIDSFLPIRPEFEILRSNSYKNSPLLGEGFRIKTKTFRGTLSQGFICKIDILGKGDFKEGDDVTSHLGVREWEREESDTGDGTAIADLPAFLKQTVEYRIQSYPEALNVLYQKPYYITNKFDGKSTTVARKDDEYRLFGHEVELKLETYKYKDVIESVMAKLKNYKAIHNVAIEGELCGPGIQQNRVGLKKVEFFAFRIMDIDNRRWLPFKEFIKICTELEIKTVEVVEVGESFPYTTMNELIKKADGYYACTRRRREGIVVCSQDMLPCDVFESRGERLSFKVISNKYLLKNE